MRVIRKILLYLVVAGLCLALLRAFGGDPFAVVQWIGSLIAKAVNKVANLFSHNSTFKNVTKNPGSSSTPSPSAHKH